MAKLTTYDELTGPIATDLLYSVDDPAGTPLTKKLPIANLLRGKVFSPKFFGAVADGSTDDTTAIQAAVDAAAAAGGGIVDGHGLTYAYGIGGTGQVGPYTNAVWGVKVSSDNIWIKDMTLKLASKPAWDNLRMNGVLFDIVGAGGYPGAAGPYLENVGISNVIFDHSAVSKADRLLISGLGVSGCIEFSHCLNWWCVNNVIIGGYGEGAIHTIMCCVAGLVSGNIIHGASRNGMWLDGCRDSIIAGNRVLGNYNIYKDTGAGTFDYNIEGTGIVFAANTDNGTGSERNRVTGNLVVNGKANGIGGTLNDSIVESNHVINLDGIGVKGMQFGFAHNANGLWKSDDLTILNNVLKNTSNIVSGVGIRLYGATASSFDGSTVEIQRAVVAGNRVNSNFATAEIKLDEQVHNSVVVNNYINGEAVVQDVSCTGNTITPNY